jgi:phosphodiesterase/alkaline phosphatase D-like protein
MDQLRLNRFLDMYASGGYVDARGRQIVKDFKCETVEQYRERYALFHGDALLKATHALVPWIIAWDGHEVANDHVSNVSEQEDDVEAFRTRRAAAYQASYEMPVCIDSPDCPDSTIYQSFAHGDLVSFPVLDTRRYRSDQQRNVPFRRTARRNCFLLLLLAVIAVAAASVVVAAARQIVVV